MSCHCVLSDNMFLPINFQFSNSARKLSVCYDKISRNLFCLEIKALYLSLVLNFVLCFFSNLGFGLPFRYSFCLSRDYSFSKFAKFTGKLIFLTPSRFVIGAKLRFVLFFNPGFDWPFINSFSLLRDHSFSTFAKFSKMLVFRKILRTY